MTERHDAELAEKLAAYKATLTEDDIAGIMAATEALKKRQATPDSPEALLSIPTLSRDDLEHKAERIVMHEETMGSVHICHVPDVTNGITYVNAYFDLHGITAEELPYVYLLSDILGDLDTKAHATANCVFDRPAYRRYRQHCFGLFRPGKQQELRSRIQV